MKKKLLCYALSMILAVSSTSVIFASEPVDGEQIVAEHYAEVVEEVVGTEDVSTDLEETKTDFMAESENIEISIPKDGNDEIVMDSDSEEAIEMSLPEEAENTEGVVTDDGTIVYDTDEDMAIAVQVLSEEQDGMTFEAVRTMITIERASAPKEYEFAFDLPKEYTLVKDTDYSDEYDEYDCGAIYI